MSSLILELVNRGHYEIRMLEYSLHLLTWQMTLNKRGASVAKCVEDKKSPHKVTLLNGKTHGKKCSHDKMRGVYLKRKIIFHCKNTRNARVAEK